MSLLFFRQIEKILDKNYEIEYMIIFYYILYFFYAVMIEFQKMKGEFYYVGK